MKPLIILFILFQSSLFGQTDTLNKLNTKGKKQGYWVQFLDQNTNPTDSSNAKYLGYELYDNGKSLFKFTKYRWKLKWILIYEPDSLQEKNLISGLFKWIDPKTNKLMCEDKYIGGHPAYLKEYHYFKRNDSLIWGLTLTADYSKKFENTIGSFYYEDLANTTRYVIPVKKYWYRKINNKWKFDRIKE
jgi:hypothetical protein